MTLKCPKCKAKLIQKGYSRHQTLDEHVMDPNGESSIKPEFRCPNKCYPRRVFWDMYGGVYSPNDGLTSLSFKIGMFHIFNKLGIKLKNIKVDDAIGNCYENAK